METDVTIRGVNDSDVKGIIRTALRSKVAEFARRTAPLFGYLQYKWSFGETMSRDVPNQAEIEEAVYRLIDTALSSAVRKEGWAESGRLRVSYRFTGRHTNIICSLENPHHLHGC